MQKKFIVRKSRDYSAMIVAESEEEALRIAGKMSTETSNAEGYCWGDDGFSDIEIEEE